MAHGIALRFGFTKYNAAHERLLAQVLDHPASATSGRKGLRPGPGAEVTIGGSPETITVAPFSAVITDPAGGGTYHVVVPDPVVLAMPTRPASGSSRLHEVVAQILNVDERSTDGADTREVRLYVAEGAAAASPAAPSVPSNHLRLRQLTVPASGVVSVSSVAPRTVAVGGIVPVRNQAERDALVMYDGLLVYREDLGYHQARINGAWTNGWKTDPPPAPARCQVRRTAAQSFSRNNTATIQWDTELRDTAAMFAPTSADITITAAGDYDVSLRFGLTNANTGSLTIVLAKNGTDVATLHRNETGVTGTTTLQVINAHARLLDLAANDVLSVKVTQDIGANRSTATGINAPELVVERVV